MTKKFYKNEKFQAWFFPIIYFLLAVSIVITGCFIFRKKYYQPIVVNGTSMWPTLSGGRGYEDADKVYHYYRNHYGLADISKSSVRGLQRFDVVVTYYPPSWGGTSSEYKIKRVWGFPGETIQLSYDTTTSSYTFIAQKAGEPRYVITSTKKGYVASFESFYKKDGKTIYEESKKSFTVNEFVLPHKTFRTVDSLRQFSKTLANDEYFVMGDNWSGSTDSFENRDNPDRLTVNELQGRVICINAYVTYVQGSGENLEMHDIEPRYNF